MKLWMIKLGATPPGRFIEQHDVFFGFAEQLSDLVADLDFFWPEAQNQWHIDAWREVNRVGVWQINTVATSTAHTQQDISLFFINLGGYRAGEFEEYHYKLLSVAANKKEAIAAAKHTDFYRDFNFHGAASHIDEQYGVDIDEIHRIPDILNGALSQQYRLNITAADATLPEDTYHIGYVSRTKLL